MPQERLLLWSEPGELKYAISFLKAEGRQAVMNRINLVRLNLRQERRERAVAGLVCDSKINSTPQLPLPQFLQEVEEPEVQLPEIPPPDMAYVVAQNCCSKDATSKRQKT